MNPMRELLAALTAANPRGAADAALGVLVKLHEARAGALFVAQEQGGLSAFAIIGDVTTREIAELDQWWAKEAAALKAGHTLRRGGGRVLAPILDDGRLCGVLYMEAGITTEPDPAIRLALAKAIRAPAPPARVEESWLGTDQDTHRLRLQVLLKRHEGNIAAVARAIGVTRRTIYLRMQRYGIPRVRTPKSTTRLQPQ